MSPQEVWPNPKPEDRKAYEAFVQAWNADDEEYQAHYQAWLREEAEVEVAGEMVKAFAYGAECDDVHDDAPTGACISEGMVCLLEFDDTSDPWHEYYGHDGTPSADPPTLSSVYGIVRPPAVQFSDSTSQQFLLVNGLPAVADNEFTVSLWLKNDGTAATWTAAHGAAWKIGYDGTSLFFEVGFPSTTTVKAASLGSPNWNNWFFVCCRKDDTDISIYTAYSAINTYLDCTSHSLTPTDGTSVWLSVDPLVSGDNPLIGKIDTFAMWDRCLTEEEVEWLFNDNAGQDVSDYVCPSGGVVLGGAASVWSGVETMHGGCRVGGSALVLYEEIGSGGAMAGGSATVLKVSPISCSGGALAGGEAPILSGIVMQGGVQVSGGGIGGLLVNIEARGGVIVGVPPTFANGFEYYDRITKPPYQVADDLHKFYFTPVLVIDPADTDGTSYLVTEDDGTTELAHDLWSYDSTTGHLHLTFKADLDRTSENVFRVYYRS